MIDFYAKLHLAAAASGLSVMGRIWSLPYFGLLLIFTFAAGAFVLSRTIYGHSINAVGGNPEASRLSGLRIPLIIGLNYTLLDALTGVAGHISASQLRRIWTRTSSSMY